MNVQDTLPDGINIHQDIQAEAILQRLRHIAEWLKPHEEFVSHLGVAEVRILILPNATRLLILWREGEYENECIYVAHSTENRVQPNHIYSLLKKYLGPGLEA
jgi:hypothetical protein